MKTADIRLPIKYYAKKKKKVVEWTFTLPYTWIFKLNS